MLCDICHGTRMIQTVGMIQPCPECGGHGSIHCCDGLQAQPESNADVIAAASHQTDEQMAPER
jgi:hypothetical protein